MANQALGHHGHRIVGLSEHEHDGRGATVSLCWGATVARDVEKSINLFV